MRNLIRRQAGRGVNAGTYKDIEKLEANLREAADNLRANAKLTSSDLAGHSIFAKGLASTRSCSWPP
jgi:hypothetical protein